ncbi:hypothetical protein MASR2M29_08430 [Spirochaetota bacterium]
MVKGDVNGQLELWLLDGDGSRQRVFKSAYLNTNSLELPFFTGQNPVGLELELVDGKAIQNAKLEFGLAEAGFFNNETGLLLAGLSFPPRAAIGQKAAELPVFDHTKPEEAAWLAAKSLFRPKAGMLAPGLLLLYSALSMLLELLPGKRRNIMPVLLAICFFALFLFMPHKKPVLFVLELPAANSNDIYTVKEIKQPEYCKLQWTPAVKKSQLNYLAIYSPLSSARLYDELAHYSFIRFRRLPAILMDTDGSLSIEKAAYLDAWAIAKEAEP